MKVQAKMYVNYQVERDGNNRNLEGANRGHIGVDRRSRIKMLDRNGRRASEEVEELEFDPCQRE
jgi:hypothetical protein